MKASTFCTEALLIDGTVRTLDSNYYLLGNKVLDGKFEIWNSATEPRFWTTSLAGTSTVDREGTTVYAGTYALKLTVDGSNSAVSAAQTIHLFPGWTYTIAFYYQNSTSGKTSKFTLADTGGNTYLLSTGLWDTSGSVSLANSNAAWTAFSLSFVVPNYETYTLTFANNSAATSNIFIDSLTILESSTGRPSSQFPRVAREAEVYCDDAAVFFGLGGSIPTTSTGIILEPRETKHLKSFDEIRTFRAVRDASLSGLLMVNYKR